ncbi:hypothetical protein [Flavobacterium sp.]|uniref:hypothetical protein n=1 Tax=Flavobacterium sp. TaxID=239 RepID=UPI002607ADDC|nr:hypothetical protein [Flavobacterium sp.]
MRNFALTILLCLLTFNFYAQDFDGYVVKNNKDTIRCKFNVGTNLFDSSIFYANSVKKKVKVLINGEKVVFKPYELISFVIEGTKRGSFKFVSVPEDDYQNFYHEIIEGRVSCYYLYDSNPQGGEPLPVAYLYKNGVLKEISVFVRNDVGEFIIDNPELFHKWMNGNPYKSHEFYQAIRDYNDYYSKKDLKSENK